MQNGRMLQPEIVSSDPEIMGGTVCFTGTRVPVKSLFDFIDGGDSIDRFLENFPRVRRDQVIAVLEYAARTLVNHVQDDSERLISLRFRADRR